MNSKGNVIAKAEKNHTKRMSKALKSEDLNLCSRLQGLSTEYKSKLGHIDHESVKMRKQADDLLSQQTRRNELDNYAEQKLRSELGLNQRPPNHNTQGSSSRTRASRVSLPGISTGSSKQEQTTISKPQSQENKSRRHSVHHISQLKPLKQSLTPLECDKTSKHIGCNTSHVTYEDSYDNEADDDDIFTSSTYHRGNREQQRHMIQSHDLGMGDQPSGISGSEIMKRKIQRARSIQELKRDSISYQHRQDLLLPSHRRFSLATNHYHHDYAGAHFQNEAQREREKQDEMYAEMRKCRYLRMPAGQEDEELSFEEIFSKD